MELFDAILTRSSAAKLSAPGPSPEHLMRIVDAATHAPDHGRLRPWRVIPLDGPARQAFADSIVAARRARLPLPTEEQLTIEREKVMRSPTLIVVGCSIDKNNAKVPEIEQILAAGAAAQNLFLAAHALGYGVMWKTGPAAYESGVKASLGLQAHDHIVAIMHVGTRMA